MLSRRGPLSRGVLRRLILAFSDRPVNNSFGPLEGVPLLWGPQVVSLQKKMTRFLKGDVFL